MNFHFWLLSIVCLSAIPTPKDSIKAAKKQSEKWVPRIIAFGLGAMLMNAIVGASQDLEKMKRTFYEPRKYSEPKNKPNMHDLMVGN